MVEAVAVINGVIEEEREDLVESKDPFLSTTFFTEKVDMWYTSTPA